MVSRINREIAERLLNEIRIHDINPGGKMVALLGSKGSGKSHFLTRLAHQMVFLHPAKQTLRRSRHLARAQPDY